MKKKMQMEVMKKMNKMKKVVSMILVLMLALQCVGCGKTYTCSDCEKKTKKAYYNPFYEDDYMCEDCAREYFAPFPYSQYRVED